MAVACSIFILDGSVQLFWTAFDMPITVVPLNVALGLQKFDFWSFQKNNHEQSLGYTWCDYFFEMPKNLFFPILKQLLMVALSQAYQKLPKTIETHPSKVNIGSARAVFLKKYLINFSQILGKQIFLNKWL